MSLKLTPLKEVNVNILKDNNQSQDWQQRCNKGLSDFKLLFITQILGVRDVWIWYLFVEGVVPIAVVFAFGHYGGVRPSDGALLYIISGSLTFTLAYLGLSTMAMKLAQLWQNGSLLYYYSLPISKISFIAALLCSRLVLLLPGFITPLIGGYLLYGLDLHLDLWLLIVVALGAFTLAVAGTAIGSAIKSYELVGIITNALVFIMMLASPSFMPISSLPLPLQLLGWLLPTTYVSNALTHCLSANYDLVFYGDLAVLVVTAALATLLTARFLVWRVD